MGYYVNIKTPLLLNQQIDLPMKRLFLILILFPLLAIAQQQKHALIIAIADYPDESGWADISSDKDIQLIKPVYEQQGFKQIMVIRDKEADKKGILSAFKKLQDNCKAGDIVLVHYSGHGQQIFDDNGDEPDGLDEALVAYGAPSDYIEGYQGEKHLRDDEFGNALLDIRSKLGKQGSMLVVVDACHSGTASRGVAKKRGGKAPIIPPHFKLSNQRESGPGYNSNESKMRGQQVAVAPMVLIAASSFDEENSETFDDQGNAVGSLSYAMARSLSKCKAQESYRALFANVLNVMNEKVPHQTPMVEGDLDYALFAGKHIAQQSYYTVKEMKSVSELVMHGGSLIGVQEGSKVLICPAGSLNSNIGDAAIEAKVVSVSANSAVLKLAKPLSGKPSDHWVFMKEAALAKLQLKYQIVSANQALVNQLHIALKSDILKAEAASPDVLIDLSNGYLRFARAIDGLVIDSILYKEDALPSFGSLVQAYAQNKYLRDFKSGLGSQLSLQLIPLNASGQPIASGQSDELLKLQAGQQVKVKVSNHGSQKLYFNIIDIQPDGKINAMVPGPQELSLKHAEQYVLAPGEEKILPYPFEIAPPYGNEVFKLFASNEPFNITPYIANGQLQTRGADRGNVLNAFKKSDMGTRGASANKSGSDEMFTSEVVFKIIR